MPLILNGGSTSGWKRSEYMAQNKLRNRTLLWYHEFYAKIETIYFTICCSLANEYTNSFVFSCEAGQTSASSPTLWRWSNLVSVCVQTSGCHICSSDVGDYTDPDMPKTGLEFVSHETSDWSGAIYILLKNIVRFTFLKHLWLIKLWRNSVL